MTSLERERMEKRLEDFDALSKQIRNVDVIIDNIDSEIDYQKEMNGVFKEIEIQIGVPGYNMRCFTFNEDQERKMKELLDSYRSDVRKRLEEL